jgi:hypothetical protein
VEIEGILGVQAPVVVYPGQVLKFSLLLWSMNKEALHALAQPEHIRVDYMRVDLFGLDVLEPHNSARKHRRMLPMQRGRVWLLDGAPKEASPIVKSFAGNTKNENKPVRSIGMPGQEPVKRRVFVPKRFQQLYNATAAEEEGSPQPVLSTQDGSDLRSNEKTQKEMTKAQKMREVWLQETQEVAHLEPNISTGLSSRNNVAIPSMSGLTLDTDSYQSLATDHLHGSADGVLSPTNTLTPSPSASTTSFPILDDPMPSALLPSENRAPSPTGSFEEDQEGADDDDKDGHFVRLDGDVLVPVSVPPNYRYLYSGIEVCRALPISGQC